MSDVAFSLAVISLPDSLRLTVAGRGGDIVTATIAHLAHSTDPRYLLCSTDFNSYGPTRTAVTTAHRRGGRLSAPTAPGLGVEPIMEALGAPVVDVSVTARSTVAR